jgi:hypothetical protein
MVQRRPYLPRFIARGPGNPLGARAMYPGGTIYRIHGTNQPGTIGRVSSGCIRLVNEDIVDLYDRLHIGTKVIVFPAERRADTPASFGGRRASTLFGPCILSSRASLGVPASSQRWTDVVAQLYCRNQRVAEH